MVNWLAFISQWESTIREILSEIPEDLRLDSEKTVMKSGLVLFRPNMSVAEVEKRLVDVGLVPDRDHVEFLATIGSIHLISMGADDGVLLDASRYESLRLAYPSIYGAWMDGVNVTSIEKYLNTEHASTPLEMVPESVLKQAVCISTRAGAKVYAASPMKNGNDYLRLSLRGKSFRYSSFEEFIVIERDCMLESLKESLEER